jgi:hypothetical protein
VDIQEEQDWLEPNLFLEPSSSDSDSSEDPDYNPAVPLRRFVSTSDVSWPGNSNSEPLNQPSMSQQANRQQEPNLDSDSETSTDSEPAKKSIKSKNTTESWKNTASTLWKPSRKVVIEPDPESIATRTRSKNVQGIHNPMASHPHDLNIDTLCCSKSGQECAKPSSDIQAHRKLCYKCALPPREDTCQHVKNN